MAQAPRAVPGQTYGEAGAQIASQQVVPLPSVGGGGAAGGGPAPASGAPLPGPIDAPTARPGEPLTTGIAGGDGAGPEALGQSAALTPIDEIRAMFAANPSDDMRRLVAYLDGY